MKKLIYLLVAVFALVSCDKDNGNEGNDPDVTKSTISAKWILSGDSQYESIEFNKSGNYIITKKVSSPINAASFTTASHSKFLTSSIRVKTRATEDAEENIIFGTYTINNNVITLSGFGIITVSEINSNKINITIKPTLGNESSATADKATEMPSTTKTDLLCQTWKITKATGVNFDIDPVGAKVLFSKAGTYFVYYTDGSNGISSWKWKDEVNGWILYSWEKPPVWSDNDKVQIQEIAANKLKISELGESGEVIYELVPSSVN